MAQDATDFDPEALQAQINLSMSLTEELVSSWIHPSFKTSNKSTKDTDKELEEYLRRPPRLGVGAPIPESTGVTARETAKLKSKLGPSKGKGPSDELNGVKTAELSDDDEGKGAKGKSVMGTKRARVDPFAVGRDNKKRKKSGVEEVAKYEKGDTQLPRQAADLNGLSLNGANEAVETDGSPVLGPASDAHVTSPSNKKKKKKRKASGTPELAIPATLGERSSNSSENVGTSSTPPTIATDTIADEEEEWTGFGSDIISEDHQIHDATTPKFCDPHAPSETNLRTSGAQQCPNRSALAQLAQSLPLLNLSGPPLSPSAEGVSLEELYRSQSSPKRKRHRKKKHMQSISGTEENRT